MTLADLPTFKLIPGMVFKKIDTYGQGREDIHYLRVNKIYKGIYIGYTNWTNKHPPTYRDLKFKNFDKLFDDWNSKDKWILDSIVIEGLEL